MLFVLLALAPGARLLPHVHPALLPELAFTAFLALGVAFRLTARVNEPAARRLLRPGRRTLPRPERPPSHGPP
ncbi:hypothetical protein AB0D83_22385 [Streptomyces decoyicus]|uniref:hypothetical protein n=1 Tax=Streptomyces decoyicus TaxID=249567 RepID=UPI0033EADE48